jgi:two-component system LytT family response regulator
MKVLVIDNEPNLRKAIRALLQGVKSGLDKLKSFQPDIVLLDVEMDDGSGFDLMKQVVHPGFQLIFVTAHNKYAIEAFQFSAIDYLLKPVDPEALQKSIQRAGANIRNKDLGKQLEVLMQQLSGKTEHEKRIVLKDIENIYFVKVTDILYCMAEGTYTKFFFSNNVPILVSKNLKEYESILEPLGFLRTHHSYLANPDKIKVYDKTDGGALILEGGHSIPVSQRKKDFVMQILENR